MKTIAEVTSVTSVAEVTKDKPFFDYDASIQASLIDDIKSLNHKKDLLIKQLEYCEVSNFDGIIHDELEKTIESIIIELDNKTAVCNGVLLPPQAEKPTFREYFDFNQSDYEDLC